MVQSIQSQKRKKGRASIKKAWPKAKKRKVEEEKPSRPRPAIGRSIENLEEKRKMWRLNP